MTLILLAVQIHPNGRVFILAAPSKEAFVSSFQQHFQALASQLASDSPNLADTFIRCRQAAFIGGVYSEFTK